jgi:hypothetical protein
MSNDILAKGYCQILDLVVRFKYGMDHQGGGSALRSSQPTSKRSTTSAALHTLAELALQYDVRLAAELAQAAYDKFIEETKAGGE